MFYIKFLVFRMTKIIDTKLHPINPLHISKKVKSFLTDITCIYNFRNSLFQTYINKHKTNLVFVLQHFEINTVILLGVQNVRVFKLLGHLPYPCFMHSKTCVKRQL